MESNSAIKILHLEDNPADAQLVQAMLKKSNLVFEYFFADNETDYLFHLQNEEIDIILSDYHLPDYSGNEALQVARTLYPLIPFVFISGTMGEDAAIESLVNGATDYVLKNKLGRVGAAVQRAYKEAQDQKARLNAERALLQSEENFHRSISESPLGIRIVSLHGKTIYVNKAFLDIYEFCNLEEFNNTPSKNRYTKESYLQHLERKEKRKRGEEISEYELSIVRKNNEVRHIKVWRKEILWNGIGHFQVINQDITEQKELTIDLIKAKDKAEESDRLKTAFLHNISHEIRTPMNSIVGFSELINDPDLLPENRKHFTNVIARSCNHLLSIITDIVSIASIEAGQVKINETNFNLNATLLLIHNQLKIQAKEQNLDFILQCSLPDGEAQIFTDETKIIQVIINLVNNAFKFTRQGYIRVGYRIADSFDAAQNGKMQQTDYLHFFVEDTGIGIPLEMHNEIFKRFSQVENSTTRQFGGSGLGLSISKAYIELLGGEMWLTSEEDKGSIFNFTIPYKRG